MKVQHRNVFPVSHLFLTGIAVIIAVSVPAMMQGADESYLSKATEIGRDSCLECHEDHGVKGQMGLHGLAAKGVSCESCHGPGSIHMETEDPAKILVPSNNPGLMDSSCLQCHAGVIKGWKGDKIQSAGMHCTDCHAVHQPPVKGTLVKPVMELCSSCHSDVNAKMHLPSHHPMKSGRMDCTSCHDMTGKVLFEKDRKNEMCLSCHAQYRGPFVFEHAPVAEDCMICHDPHGSVANNLLKQNEPFICLSCHQMHFHTQLEGYIGDFESPIIPGRGGTSNAHSLKEGMLTKCTQCHAPVHGSDLPSQGISSMGKSLTR
jgi:DmsE family decaheme c-type cytochrome